MSTVEGHDTPRKRGRPKKRPIDGAKNPLRKAKRRAVKVSATTERIELDHTIRNLVNLIERAAQPLHRFEVSKIRVVADNVCDFGNDIDELLTDLRRELHIALGTRLDTDAYLPRAVVDVLELFSDAAEQLREASGGLTKMFPVEAK